MSLKSVMASTAVLALALVVAAPAQQREIAGDMTTIKGMVEAIDHSNRVLTLKMDDGEFENVTIPKSAERFDEVKIGDTLQVRYYDNVTVRLKDAGEPDVNEAEIGAGAAESGSPAGHIATQRRMTVKVTELDHQKGVVTVEGPNGYKYSRRIEDKKAAQKVKVGDRIDMTWTEAVQIAIIPGQ
jgi:ribosomal 50S subunit-recycling heat shock protein